MTGHSPCAHERYRLTCAEFDELWTFAGGRCQICRKPPEETPDGKLFIDHAGEYSFFAVRGLLCSKCNSLMAYIDRGKKRDRRAFEYRANAWFVRVLHERHAAKVAAARALRLPVAKLPTRPTAEEPDHD